MLRSYKGCADALGAALQGAAGLRWATGSRLTAGKLHCCCKHQGAARHAAARGPALPCTVPLARSKADPSPASGCSFSSSFLVRHQLCGTQGCCPSGTGCRKTQSSAVQQICRVWPATEFKPTREQAECDLAPRPHAAQPAWHWGGGDGGGARGGVRLCTQIMQAAPCLAQDRSGAPPVTLCRT